MPARVPPVPTAQMKPSTLPSVWLPDFRAGGLVVDLPVRYIVELLRPDGAPLASLRGKFLGHSAGDVDVVVRVLVGHGGDLAQVGAAHAQHVLLFLGLGFGDDDHRAVTARLADQGEPDAGIARRSFDDDTAGLQLAVTLRVANDGPGRPVLDGTARVEELGLAQDLAAGHFGEVAEADERRVPDCADQAFAQVHVCCPPFPIGEGD